MNFVEKSKLLIKAFIIALCTPIGKECNWEIIEIIEKNFNKIYKTYLKNTINTIIVTILIIAIGIIAEYLFLKNCDMNTDKCKRFNIYKLIYNYENDIVYSIIPITIVLLFQISIVGLFMLLLIIGNLYLNGAFTLTFIIYEDMKKKLSL